MTLLMTTGTLTDIVFVEGTHMLQQMHVARIIDDLTDYYPWISPELRDFFESTPAYLDSTLIDGRFWALPLPDSGGPAVILIWSDWLKT